MDVENIKAQIQYLNQQLQELDEYLTSQVEEVSNIKKLINDLKSFESLKDKDVIIPVFKGVFAKLKVSEFNGFVVNVGSNVLVDKDYDGVSKLLSDNIKTLNDNIESIKSQQKKIVSMIEALNSKLR